MSFSLCHLFPVQGRASCSSAALGRKVVLQSAACGVFCEMAVISAKLSPSISWLMASLRQAMPNIFGHSGDLDKLPFCLSSLFFNFSLSILKADGKLLKNGQVYEEALMCNLLPLDAKWSCKGDTLCLDYLKPLGGNKICHTY